MLKPWTESRYGTHRVPLRPQHPSDPTNYHKGDLRAYLLIRGHLYLGTNLLMGISFTYLNAKSRIRAGLVKIL